jgi:benzoyl-CoA 2,3-dioxygenase component B
VFAGGSFTPEGKPISEAEWNRRKDEWLPSESDRAYVKSLMARPVINPGEMANWIAAPPRGIDGKALDFQYVRAEA